MNRPVRPSPRFFVSLLLALTTLGCTEGCGGGDTPPSTVHDPDGGLTADATTPNAAPPTVIETVPAHLATGVEADATFVVRFSERMDTGSVEAAYASTELPVDSVHFVWNDAGDTLTIVPSEPLALAFGDASVPPKTYSLSIGTSAASADGEPLGTPLLLTFSTLRRVMTDVPAIGSLTGRATSVGSASTLLVAAGDFATNAAAVSVASFPLESLPSDVRLDAALLVASEASLTGTPDEDLGELRAEHVFFPEFDASVYSAPLLDGLPNVEIAERSKGAPYERVVDITAFVLDDLANREARSDRTQLRLRYPTATDADGVTDLLAFELDSLRIRYIVLLP